MDISKLGMLTGALKDAKYGDYTELIQSLRDGGQALLNDNEARNHMADMLEKRYKNNEKKERAYRNMAIIYDIARLVTMGYTPVIPGGMNKNDMEKEESDGSACAEIAILYKKTKKYNVGYDLIVKLWKGKDKVLNFDLAYKLGADLTLRSYRAAYIYNSRMKVSLGEIEKVYQEYLNADNELARQAFKEAINIKS